MHTEAMEDYLKTIYELQNSSDKVSTNALAEHLNITPASASGMIRRLAEMNLVRHEPYQGVALTKSGLKVALEVIRHHRLVELYLSEALGVPWDKVHEEAEKWEHVLSEDLEERIDAALGYPTIDPHGSPIPARDGSITKAPQICLNDLPLSQMAMISEVHDRDPALLRHFGDMALFPGTLIQVIAQAPFNGPLTIEVGDEKQQYTLGREVTKYVFVVDWPKNRSDD